MDSKLLKTVVKELVGEGVLGYALKSDGHLIVINARGEKQHIDACSYQKVLRKLTGKGQQNSAENKKPPKVEKGKGNDQAG